MGLIAIRIQASPWIDRLRRGRNSADFAVLRRLGTVVGRAVLLDEPRVATIGTSIQFVAENFGAYDEGLCDAESEVI